MSESCGVYAVSVVEDEKGLVVRAEGFASERTSDGDIGSSISVAVGKELGCDVFGISAVALDIRRTNKGRICFPSELV